MIYYASAILHIIFLIEAMNNLALEHQIFGNREEVSLLMLDMQSLSRFKLNSVKNIDFFELQIRSTYRY